MFTGLQRLGNSDKGRATGEAIDQRCAIEQHPGRQRAENEVFETRFGRPGRIAIDRGNHIKRQGLEFETEIDGDQVVR